MPELLLELFSEEIPARFQRKAADDLKKAVTGALVEAGLVYESAKAFVTPRRLALSVVGIPPRSPDLREEKKGPRVGAPQQAIDGFLKAAGLTSIDQAKIESDPKKGDFYVAVIEKHGRHATDVLAEAIPQIIRSFPWPKSMRWGGSSTFVWVRPLKRILCILDGAVVPFDLRHGDDDAPKVFEQEALSSRAHLTEDPAELAQPTWVLTQAVARPRKVISTVSMA